MKIKNRFTGELIIEIKTGINADLRGADLNGADLRGADLRYANLNGANLIDADLKHANLRGADLKHANLRGADLIDADLRYANLRSADLSNADLDFSCLPLWCGSFEMKVDTRFIWQIIAHLGRLDTSNVSKKAKLVLKLIKPFVDEFCRYRTDVDKIL